MIAGRRAAWSAASRSSWAGFEIPVGIEINPSIAAIHRRRDRYPSPREFRPERFLGDDAPDTYTWLPFGGGTRRCLGASFASFEMARGDPARARADRPRARRPAPEKGVRKGITFTPKRGVRVVMRAPASAAHAGEEPAHAAERLPAA